MTSFRAAHPEVRVLILTTFDRDDYLFDALQAGASGFLLKNAQAEQLVDALRAVGHGHALLAPEVTKRVIAQMSAVPAGAKIWLTVVASWWMLSSLVSITMSLSSRTSSI